jgi:hypothetical protein
MRIIKLGYRIIPLVAASLLSFSAGGTKAQTQQVPTRITESVDETNRVQLRGNVHPLARAEFDQGVVADSQPINRMLLLLQRSSEQQAALSKLMEEQLTTGAPNFHKWLTPEEFGKQFGPADEDIQAVTDWLTSRGFQVSKVSKGRTVIEFSDTAGHVRNAFHTEMHHYLVKGEAHMANVSDPQIPAALAPVVAGIVGLHNFRHQPYSRMLGTFRRTKATGEVRPLFTYTDSNGKFFGVGPADFAKIYNVPATVNGIPAGQGQTIAVVGRTNINIQDVRDFRNMFGLPLNDPQIIFNGPDPGIISQAEETEADLDVEWSGAVAPGATIDFVVTETPQTNASDGVDLSALYIVDNDLAPVLSESFGSCESAQGTTGNQFQNNLWEQAAAQGITVSVASGDDGSAGCDPTSATQTAAALGLDVSGNASTPFNIAVGGTDFDNTLTNYPAQYWNTANTSTATPVPASARSYIPEVPWNDSCAVAGSLTGCATVKSDGSDLVAGSGGPSNCTTQNASGTCTSGYPKPPWQRGPGVPADLARDIPDVSFFASDGNHKSFYIICQSDQDPVGGTGCNLATSATSPNHDFQAVGGTSGSTPSFAAIMALVNQQTGQRQGNANLVLYALAAKTGSSCTSNPSAVTHLTCIFYDVAKSNNSVACQGGTANCSNTNPGQFGIMATTTGGTTPAFNATAGYDRATGLGSVNVANLLANWSSVKFIQSSTAISAFPLTVIAHGKDANFTVDVTSGSGTPTGNVTLIASPSGFAQEGIGPFPLIAGAATISTNLLPGSPLSGGVAQPYPVVAHYAGDGTFGASDSSAVNVTVSQEKSQTVLRFVTFISSGVPIFNTGAITVAYGSPYILRVDVRNSAGAQCSPDITAPTTPPTTPCPTGTVNLTDNGSPLKDFSGGTTGTTTLNSQGYLEDQPVQLPAGSHSLVARYAGDNSFSSSPSPTDTVTITKATTTIVVTPSPTSIVSGGSVTLTATISTNSNGEAPCGSGVMNPGTVQFMNGSSVISGTVTYTGTSGAQSSTGLASCTATLVTTITALGIPDTPSPWRPKLPPGLIWLLGCCAALYGLFLWKMPPARRRGYAYAGLVVFALAAAGIAGCGGGSSKTTQSKTVTITAKFAGDSNYTASSGTTSVTVQ